MDQIQIGNGSYYSKYKIAIIVNKLRCFSILSSWSIKRRYIFKKIIRWILTIISLMLIGIYSIILVKPVLVFVVNLISSNTQPTTLLGKMEIFATTSVIECHLVLLTTQNREKEEKAIRNASKLAKLQSTPKFYRTLSHCLNLSTIIQW